MYNAKVKLNEVMFDTTTRVLVLEVPENCHYEIKPGAGATLKLNEVSRPFSFAASEEGYWTFYIREVENGAFNHELSVLKVDDYVEVSDFFHFFVIEDGPKNYYFATGVGISPFDRALMTFTPPQKVFYGAKTVGDLLALSDMIASGIPVIPVVSRDKAVSPLLEGHITDYITADIIDPEARYYVCGLDQMVNDVTSRLIELGASYDQISVELFYMKE